MKIATPSARPGRIARAAVTAAVTAACSAALAAGLAGVPSPATAQATSNPAALSAAAASSSLVDPLGRPTPAVQKAVKDFAHQPGIPAQVRDALLRGLEFTAGTGNIGGPDLPQDSPEFRQGFWPTVSRNCMGPGLNSTGSLIAVPGPARIPAPAPTAGQATFVFTALGTKPAADQQGSMNVHWINLANLRSGVTPLLNHGINKTGPATLSNAADTGSGPVLAVVSGAVTTDDGRTCGFAPTALSVTVK